MKENPPAIKPALVQEFVGTAHRDLDGTKSLLRREPGLINAAWDWGGGDWETALGAASHMGRRDIAEFLLSRGARLDLFAAAMLGMVAVVRAALKVDPRIADVRGPHGIPLVHHAEIGGDEATIRLLRRVQTLPHKDVAG